jgi:hypothetical protein
MDSAQDVAMLEARAVCAAAIDVGDVAALTAIVPRPLRDWISEDLHATAVITLDVADVIGHGSTLSAQLRVRDSVQGIELVDNKRVRVAAGTSFRMQYARAVMEPFIPVHRVTFLAPCSAPCAEGEQRCARDGVCYPGYPMQDYCLSCSIASPQRCACMGPGGDARADGTGCTVFKPGTQPWVGACQDGVCRLPARGHRPGNR